MMCIVQVLGVQGTSTTLHIHSLLFSKHVCVGGILYENTNIFFGSWLKECVPALWPGFGPALWHSRF